MAWQHTSSSCHLGRLFRLAEGLPIFRDFPLLWLSDSAIDLDFELYSTLSGLAAGSLQPHKTPGDFDHHQLNLAHCNESEYGQLTIFKLKCFRQICLERYKLPYWTDINVHVCLTSRS